MSLSPRHSEIGEKPTKILKTEKHFDVYTQLHNHETSSPASEEVCSEEEDENWSRLPHVALVKVFSCLEESDKLQVQFVCKRWYSIIRHSPCLWRAKSFRFSGRDSRDLTHIPYRYATHYVRTFGKYLHYLHFRLYSPVSSGVCKKFQKSIKVCLSHLIKQKAKLKELSLPLLHLDRSQWMLYREDMCAALANFFCKGQHMVEEVYFRGARAPFADGYKVLYALGYNTGSTVTVLDMEDFFDGRLPVFDLPQFIDCMKYFTRLEELDLNYGCVSEEILQVLAKNLEPNALQRMFIKVYAHDPHNQVIWGQAWTSLTNRCPNLTVEMLFQRVMTFGEHFRILCPQVPLTEVIFDGCYIADRDWQIQPTLASILPHFKEKLTKLCIDLPDTNEVFDNELLYLVQSCPNLTLLKLNAFVSTRFVSKLLEMKQEKKCNITILRARLFVRDYDTAAEERDLEQIFNKYRDIITDEMEDYYVTCGVSM
ncbi:F-box only protein 39-like [Clavelina lepadiformis]|uniref:F-box only protein 39-like n=1 Tax=Clavelina lepadiformis TaxID=159417 RepID=UPI0040438C1B